MNFAQKYRLVWIDAALANGSAIRSADLCEAFGISVPQASKDLSAYREQYGDLIAYDRPSKCYRRKGDVNAFPKTWHWPVLAAQTVVKNA